MAAEPGRLALRLRQLWYLPLGFAWTVAVLVPCIIVGALTVGRYNHRLPAFFGRLWSAGILRLIGVRIRILGREHLPRHRSSVLVMNHRSLLDMFSVGMLAPPGLVGLAKREFAWMPLLGQAMWLMGQVFVDRSNPAQARRSLAKLAALMEKHPRTVIIFPEGTRSRSGALQPFRPGAFRLAAETGAPIVPVVLYGAWERLEPDSLLVRPGELVMVVHPPIESTGWTPADAAGEAARLHARYAGWLAEGPPA